MVMTRKQRCGRIELKLFFIFECWYQGSAASRKERRVYRKQQRADFELVHESKVIWEHLRAKKRSSGRTLAQEEIIALATGHFREVCTCVCV